MVVQLICNEQVIRSNRIGSSPADKEPALLAVFDKITTMAKYDANLVNTLLESATVQDETLQRLLDEMGQEAEGLLTAIGSIDLPLNQETTTCPHCGKTI